MSWLEETFGALRVRDFRLVWSGSFCASLAFFMSTVIQSVVAFDLAGSNVAVGGVLFANGLSMLALGPLGGALADRWPKRLVIATSQSLPTAVFFGLAVAYALEAIRLAHVLGGSFLIGLTYAFLIPARQALIVEIVSARIRGNAVALGQVAITICQIAGPGLAGVLLLWQKSGPAGAYALMAGLYFAASLALIPLPRSRMRPDAADTHVLGDLIAGIGYVVHRRRLRTLVLLYISVIMFGMPYATVLPGFVERELGRPSEAFAFLSLVAAIGGLCSSLFVTRFADRSVALPLFCSMGGVFGAGLLLLSTVPSFGLAAVAAFIVGTGSAGFMTLNAAAVVRSVDPPFLGRVMSITLIAFGLFGLMGLPVGALADHLGERPVLALLGLTVCTLVAVIGLRLLHSPTDDPLEPLPKAA